jgi:dolichol-phosphate mannosyltransferase
MVEESQEILFSVVIPEYRGEKMVPALVERLKASMETITNSYEIILVNDCSPDDTWNAILKESEKDKRVKGINLSRNFGQHNAITAGLSYVKGEWIIVMDCDLQDRPEEIPRLYKKALEGYDVVRARRVMRQDRFFKRLSSSLFHKVINFVGGKKSDKAVGNFGIFNKRVIAEVNKMPETTRGFGMLLSYVGFNKTTLDVEHANRPEGKSSYTFSKMVRQAMDAIIASTNNPLRITIVVGFCISALSLAIAFYNVIARLVNIIRVPGFTTTVFSIWFVGGVILSVLGIHGLYISKIFDEVKGRQLFIVKDTVNI